MWRDHENSKKFEINKMEMWILRALSTNTPLLLSTFPSTSAHECSLAQDWTILCTWIFVHSLKTTSSSRRKEIRGVFHRRRDTCNMNDGVEEEYTQETSISDQVTHSDWSVGAWISIVLLSTYVLHCMLKHHLNLLYPSWSVGCSIWQKR